MFEIKNLYIKKKKTKVFISGGEFQTVCLIVLTMSLQSLIES